MKSISSTLFGRLILLVLLNPLLYSAMPTYAEGEGDAAAPVETARYIDIKPAFVENFGGPSKKLKFVKADVSVRVNSKEAEAAVESNIPLIRHQIVMTLSQQTDAALSSSLGQEKVRTDILTKVQEALKEETGSPQVEDLLFTNFVIQR